MMKKLFAAFAFSALAVAAHAGAMESLENFVRTAKTGRADFTQTITAPPRDGQAARTKTSSGSFEFQRPDHFRFEYTKPFQQTIVADGKTVWLHDKDLNQVSQRRQGKVLAQTPAAVIAASSDIESIKRDFDLQALPDSGGLQWVQATPKQKEGQLTSMKVGFRGDQLAAHGVAQLCRAGGVHAGLVDVLQRQGQAAHRRHRQRGRRRRRLGGVCGGQQALSLGRFSRRTRYGQPPGGCRIDGSGRGMRHGLHRGAGPVWHLNPERHQLCCPGFHFGRLRRRIEVPDLAA